MRRLGIGEVCDLLGIRPHVLRYWEQEVPFLTPPKNVGGRRVYGDREINLLCRLKFLVQERRYTLEGAKLAVLDESSDSRTAGEKALVHMIRKELLDARSGLEELKTDLSRLGGHTVFPEGQDHLAAVWRRLPEERRRAFAADLAGMPRSMIDLASSLLADRVDERAEIPKFPVETLEGPGPFREAEQALRRGRVAAITLMPEERVLPERLAGRFFELSSAIRESSYDSGRLPIWYLFVDQEDGAAFQAFFKDHAYFNFDPGNLVFAHRPPFPALDEASRLMVAEDGRLVTYASGYGGALLMMKTSPLLRHFRERGVEILFFLPVSSRSLGFPEPALLDAHLRDGADVSFTCFRSGPGLYSTTGVYLVNVDFLRRPETRIDFFARETSAKCIKSASESADLVEERRYSELKSSPWLLLPRAERARAFLERRS